MPQAPPTEPKRCAGTRRDGQPCHAVAVTAEHCFVHDPARAADREAARRRGGRNSSKIVRLHGLLPPRLRPVFEKLESALSEVHDGKLSPRTALAMAAVARALVSVLQAGEMEERLRQIEAAQQGRRAVS